MSVAEEVDNSSLSMPYAGNDGGSNTGANNVVSVGICDQLGSHTPSVSVQYNHQAYEPGEIVNMDQPTGTASPASPHEDTSSPPTLIASTPGHQASGSSSSYRQIAPAGVDVGASRTNGSSNSSTCSNPAASDHCYGLPYQDHNYGSLASQARSVSGNGNGGNGNCGNGGSYNPSGNQRHPSGSHRSSSSISGVGGPTPLGRYATTGANGGGMYPGRRLCYYTNGNHSKPPTLPQYGSPSVPHPPTALDLRVLPAGDHGVRRSSFSDDDGSVPRAEAYKLLPEASSSTSINALSTPNGAEPSSNVLSTVFSGFSNGSAGQTGITVTTNAAVVRSRVRSIGIHPNLEKTGRIPHGPAIHPRLAPPNVARSGMTTSLTTRLPQSPPLGVYRGAVGRTITTSHTVGTNFQIPMLSNLQKQSHQFHPQHPYSMRMASSNVASSVLPQRPPPESFPSGHGKQNPPPKRPGRPKGARSVHQHQRQQHEQAGQTSMPVIDKLASPTKVQRRRKSAYQRQQMPPTFSQGVPLPLPGICATGMEKPLGGLNADSMPNQTAELAPASAVDTVSSVLEEVVSSVTTAPSLSLPPGSYQAPFNMQQRSAHSVAVHEAIGGPPAVGTSPIIPAHPLLFGAAAGVGLGAGAVALQQQQFLAAAASSQEKFSLPSSTAPSSLGQEEFQALYNDRMSYLFAQVGLDKDDDGKGVKAVSPLKTDRQHASPTGGKTVTQGHKRSPIKTDGAMRQATRVNAHQSNESKSTSTTTDGKKTSAESDGDEGEGDSSSDDEWRGKDYTTRCLCEMGHNDEFMIQCDQCEVWQHCECMGLDTKNIPENYLCERCDPRELKLTGAEAQRLQHAKVAQWKKKKNSARRRRRTPNDKRTYAPSGSSVVAGGRGRPKKSAEPASVNRKRTISSDDASGNKRSKLSPSPAVGDVAFTEATKNVSTPKVARIVRASGDTVGASSLLSQLPSEPMCKSMFVAVGRHGLVATNAILPDLPITEYRGKIYWYADFEKPGGRSSVVSPYILRYKSGDADGSEVLDFCVDARYVGTSARFVRRSCQPNAQVKHVVYNGAIHILLVSTELIECSAEITIPFDYDISKRNCVLECACANSPLLTPSADCPVTLHNQALLASGSFPSNDNAGDGSADQLSSDGSPTVKRRPGRPPGSGKRRATSNGSKPASATTAAARKKAKKARGFKVKIGGKKGLPSVGSNYVGRGNAKGAKIKMKLKLGYQQRAVRRYKPTATADLTKRRFSDDVKDEPKDEGDGNEDVEPVVPGHFAASASTFGITKKSPGSKLSRQKFVLSPTSTPGTAVSDQQSPQHLSREDRKMQSLVEQISRMEQREQKKKEKKLAKLQGSGKSRSDSTKRAFGRLPNSQVGRKPTIAPSGTRRTTSTAESATPARRRRRAESEAVGAASSAKRPRLWSRNEENTSSESSVDLSEHDAGTSSRTLNQLSPNIFGRSKTEGLSDLLRATAALSGGKDERLLPSTVHGDSSSPPLAQQKHAASDVAKKRWLRQAMSEDGAHGTISGLATAASVYIDTKNVGEHATPMQVSPSTAVAPPKKRIAHEFSSIGFMDQSSTAPNLRVASEISRADESDGAEGPISAVEAAQLLAELHNQPVVPQPIVPQIDGTKDWQPTVQEDDDGLKEMYSGEQSRLQRFASGDVHASQTGHETTSGFGPAAMIFTPATTHFTTQSSGGISDVASVIRQEGTLGYAYSTIEDVFPVASFGTRADDASLAPTAMQIQKKKMSIEEYKKRKRESVNDATTPGTPTQDSVECSPTPNFSTPPPTAAPIVQRPQSFIPQIKGDAMVSNRRLSSVPDPATIGKGSATLEDLRKRIYNRASVGRKQSESADVQQQSQPSSATTMTGRVQTSRDPRSGANASTSAAPATPPPQDLATADATSAVANADSAERLPLEDRLRFEFGFGLD